MKTTPVSAEDLKGVFPVPPLARKQGAGRTLDFEQSGRLLRRMKERGLTRFLYGGNAFLYHLTLAEYEQLLEWLGGFEGDLWAIPSLGPSYGRAMDQALLLRRYKFPCALMLPCADPRDARGLERGYREAPDAAGLAETGPVPPYLFALSATQLEQLTPVAQTLLDEDARA